MTSLSQKRVVQFIAYVALILVLISLAVGKIFPATAYVCGQIATITSYVITAIVAFMYAKSKRNPVFMILYIAVVITLIIMFFI